MSKKNYNSYEIKGVLGDLVTCMYATFTNSTFLTTGITRNIFSNDYNTMKIRNTAISLLCIGNLLGISFVSKKNSCVANMTFS